MRHECARPAGLRTCNLQPRSYLHSNASDDLVSASPLRPVAWRAANTTRTKVSTLQKEPFLGALVKKKSFWRASRTWQHRSLPPLATPRRRRSQSRGTPSLIRHTGARAAAMVAGVIAHRPTGANMWAADCCALLCRCRVVHRTSPPPPSLRIPNLSPLREHALAQHKFEPC